MGEAVLRAFPLILSPVPLPVAQLAARLAFARIISRHPRFVERLGEYAGRTYCIAPDDLPFEFRVTPRLGLVRADRRARGSGGDVRITGALVPLLALAEGRLDGDAEFFGRQIAIEGDMEAMLALRNALESDAIDFVSDLAPGGPLRLPVETVLGAIRSFALARR